MAGHGYKLESWETAQDRSWYCFRPDQEWAQVRDLVLYLSAYALSLSHSCAPAGVDALQGVPRALVFVPTAIS